MSDELKTQLVMTLVGRDRPGLVETMARLVESHEGNWLESRMTHLADHFAGLLLVKLPSEQVAAFQKSLSELEEIGVQVTVQKSDPGDATPSTTKHIQLELTGYDRPGIVHMISDVLAHHGVNIEELETSLFRAPMSGELTFRASAALAVPSGLQVDRLSEALEKIGSDLMVDVRLEEDK